MRTGTVFAFKFLCILSIAFLASCASTATPNIHLNAGGVEMELTQPALGGARADLSPDGKYVLTGGLGKESGFKLWDISKGAQINIFKAERASEIWMIPIHAVFSPDGKYALSSGKTLKLWDLSSGKKIRTIGNEPALVISSLSADGCRVISITDVNFFGTATMFLWDVTNGHEINHTSSRERSAPSVALSPDGRYALSGHHASSGFATTAKMVLWDATTGEKIQDFIASEGSLLSDPRVNSVAFSPDGKHALSGGTDGTIRLWDITSRTELKRIKGHTGLLGVTYVTFSPDGKYIFSGGSDGLVKLWDASSGAEIRTYNAYSGSSSFGLGRGVAYAALSADGKYIISQTGDGAVRIWNALTGEEIASLIGFEDGEWLAITSEGYYNSSEKGAQNLKVKFEGKEYTVDQFYDVFYRPDIVAAKLRGENIKDLVTITMQDAIKTPPPVVEINPIGSATNEPKVKVCYKAKSIGGGIGEVRLFHNGKLIQSDGYYRTIAKSTTEKTQLASLYSKAIYEDMRSVSIKGKIDSTPLTSKSKGEVFEDCKVIEAVPGDNEVSVTAFNGSNTVQGYMKTVKFNSTIKPEDPHLYILAVGIDHYKDGSVDLKYAVKDAKDIGEKLKVQSATLYKPQNIHYVLLTDKDSSKKSITDRINELSQIIKPTDSFILFVAGHGVLLQNQYYMLTSEYDGNVNENTMISSNEIVEMSKQIKSLSQLIIFDTCHAGGVDTIVSGLYDARMSVLAKKMGLHIYASASDKQAAMDGYKSNGLFTYALLDGLNNNKEADKNKDGKVTVVGLGEYSRNMTTNISKEIGHSQTPLIINFGKDNVVYQLH